MSTREEVLGRIRTALAQHPARPGPEIPRGYRQAAAGIGEGLADLFAERLADYGSKVRRVGPAALPDAICAAVTARGARRLAVPPGLDLPSPPPDTEIITDDGLPAAILDTLDGVITTAALAIAGTGTIVLDGGPGQGRRALTLIPDYHLCIVDAGQIVAGVPEAVHMLRPGRPLTWISGPSATSDIEFTRVQGVHGPRTLEVILTEDQPTG